MPSLVADTAYAILISDSRSASGNFFNDEDVLRQNGGGWCQVEWM